MGVPVSKPIYINAHHVPLLLFSETRLELEKLLARLHLGLYLLWTLNQTTAGLVREPSGSVTGTQLPPIPATNPQAVGVLLPQFTSAHTIQSSKEWKKPHVPPVFEKGKKKDPGNYRPVSLTSLPGKEIEQLILETFFQAHCTGLGWDGVNFLHGSPRGAVFGICHQNRVANTPMV